MNPKIKNFLDPLRLSHIEKSGTILGSWKFKFLIELEHNKLKNRTVLFLIERIVLVIVIAVIVIANVNLIKDIIEFWTFDY